MTEKFDNEESTIFILCQKLNFYKWVKQKCSEKILNISGAYHVLFASEVSRERTPLDFGWMPKRSQGH